MIRAFRSAMLALTAVVSAWAAGPFLVAARAEQPVTVFAAASLKESA